MRICVFGASGQTGREVVAQALEQGHSVLAPVRSPDKLEISHPNLSVSTCDVLDEKAVQAQSLSGVQHVIIALGSKELRNTTVRSKGTEHIVDAMKRAAPSARVWVISAAGTGNSNHQLSLFNRMLAKWLLGSVMKEHEAQEQTVMLSGLDYSILRPTGLANKSKLAGYQWIEQGKLPTSQIARSQLAASIVDNLDKPELINKALCITGA